MPLPALVVGGIVVVVQATGAFTQAANFVIAVDKAIPAVIDLRPQVDSLLHPRPVVQIHKKKAARQ
jgi:hypothetical protein